jgi:hypothetical protein
MEGGTFIPTSADQSPTNDFKGQKPLSNITRANKERRHRENHQWESKKNAIEIIGKAN